MVVDLRRLFAPKAIAVVGSARECGRVVAQNRALGFAGALWPVHPTRSTVAGLAPGTRGGTSVFTWAASGVARARLATSVFTLMRPLTVEPRSP